ncbi:hypothetical protein [Kosakonia radicincitans]|uniref:hypothetical protein n=1 Tax=Kosakonia radicincitans TaxID=283686 RepID=UPI0012EB0A34|nr:hypothetical protein [Kosakonia radicincitans]MDD7994485.1 hypothetical protein [Kosakonia radicincitans]
MPVPGLPEIQDEQSQGEKLKALAGLFNGLFRELCAIFPYLSNKPQEDLDEMRRQWLQSMGFGLARKSTQGCAWRASRKKPLFRRLASSSPGAARKNVRR